MKLFCEERGCVKATWEGMYVEDWGLWCTGGKEQSWLAYWLTVNGAATRDLHV